MSSAAAALARHDTRALADVLVELADLVGIRIVVLDADGPTPATPKE